MPIAVDLTHEDPRTYYASAFGIGVVAAAVMTVALWLARLAGLTQFDLGMTLGTATVFNDAPTPGAWVQGFIVVLTFGGIFALAYAAAFDLWGYRARAWEGALIGLAHAAIGGALLGWLMPLLHTGRANDPSLADPGFAAMNYGGPTVAIFFAMHMLYGAIVGGWLHYSPLAKRHYAEEAERHHPHGPPAAV
jgi:hypothetical protein